MTLIDDPRAWILRLFELEEREGGGADCKRFADGYRPKDVPLSDGELVIGVYKNKYYFTPIALIVKFPDRIERICWADVTSCTTRHGEGAKVSDVSLLDGRNVQIQVGELAKGWTGRVSQLFHQMIKRYGHRAALGRPLMSATEFFSKAEGPYCIAPNLEPHPSLEEFRIAIDELVPQVSGARALFSIFDDEGELVSDEIIFVAPRAIHELQEFAKRFGADGIDSVDENTMRKVGDIPPEFHVWRVVWD